MYEKVWLHYVVGTDLELYMVALNLWEFPCLCLPIVGTISMHCYAWLYFQTLVDYGESYK